MATVNQFVDGFNQGDTERALAACAEETSIIDEFPPYEWGGAGACASWTGSMFTFALEKETSGWRITGWSWAKD